MVIGGDGVVFTPSDTVSRTRVLAGGGVGVLGVGGRGRGVVTEVPRVGERLSLGVGRSCAGEADGERRKAGCRIGGRHRRGGWLADTYRMRRSLLTPNVPLLSE